MTFNLKQAISILERTPNVLNTLFKNLPEDWTHNNEGPDTWSPYDILGHLVHGEKTDWIPRAKIILSDDANKTFKPFDRFAQFKNSKGKSLNNLLLEFEKLRRENLETLQAMQISETDLKLKGIHPELGTTTLEHLLATWVTHDLGHIAQITRVMAKQYKPNVGPWEQYLGILNK